MKVLEFILLIGMLIAMSSIYYGIWTGFKAKSEKIVKGGLFIGIALTFICVLLMAGIEFFSM